MSSRGIFLSKGIVASSNGSAYVEYGSSKVICSVAGPKSVQQREVVFRPRAQIVICLETQAFNKFCDKSTGDDNKLKEWSRVIQNALEPMVCLDDYPASTITVSLSILEEGAEALAACLTAASVALVDAAIRTFDIVVGCYIQEDSESSLTVGFLPSLNEIAAFHFTGSSRLTSVRLGTSVETVHSLVTAYLPIIRSVLTASD